ncbi:hypothetical protein ZIOFF_033608 [Zingiber officinale]|uniref:Uncharacterized protein n=1 Tax=Zingiber officinale TaxID=94328 RepID=A0A8J5L7I1_ZINOF|nr:hypothetical protein ZIOFF_033608 [Zingiber officinale]
MGVFGFSIKKRILPNLKVFMGVCGISEEKASQAMRSRPEFLAQNLDSLQSLSISKETLEAKHKLLSGLGLSESDFFTAIRKKPTLLNISQPNMRRKIEFFIKEVGYQPSFVVQQPLLLLFSLEKRVIPRFRVCSPISKRSSLSYLTFVIRHQACRASD